MFAANRKSRAAPTIAQNTRVMPSVRATAQARTDAAKTAASQYTISATETSPTELTGDIASSNAETTQTIKVRTKHTRRATVVSVPSILKSLIAPPLKLSALVVYIVDK